MSDGLSGVSPTDGLDANSLARKVTEGGLALHEGALGFAQTALNQASQLGRDFQSDPLGTINSVGQQMDRAVLETGRSVDASIQSGVRTAHDGIQQGVSWTGQQIHNAAEFARNQIPGDNPLSQHARDLITGTENIQRFGVGVIGGVTREAASLLGTGAQLTSTAVQMLGSQTKRQEVGEAIVSGVSNAASAAYQYGSSVISDPSRITSDLRSAYQAGRDVVGSVIKDHQTAIEEGRGPEQLGMTSGQVATYLIPVGGGPARGALTGAVREGGELVAREGTEALARNGVRASDDVSARLINESDRAASQLEGVNLFRTGELQRQMSQSPIGQKVLDAANRHDIDLRFNVYNEARPPRNLHGSTVGNEATVHLRNTQNGLTYRHFGPNGVQDVRVSGYQFSAAVGVHEGLHALGVAGSRRAEALVRIAEREHLGMGMNRANMRQILTEMGSGYSNLPWRAGRTTPNFPDLKF